MSKIYTAKMRTNNQLSGGRLVHNLTFLESADSIDNTRTIRDYGVSADLGTPKAVDIITYDSAGLAIMPANNPIVSSQLVNPIANEFICIAVADWSVLASIEVGVSSANGFLFAANGSFAAFNGLYQSTGNAAISGTANVPDFGGLCFTGKKNGTLTLKTFIPGGSVVTVGTGAVPNFDVLIDNNVTVASSTMGGILLATVSSFAVGDIDSILTDYVNDINTGVIRIPPALDKAF